MRSMQARGQPWLRVGVLFFVGLPAGLQAEDPAPVVTSPVVDASASAPAIPVVEELWAGHQVVTGVRSLPVFGDIETCGESFVLARAHILPDRIELEQWPCVFRFKPVLGVGVRMTPAAMASLPRARIRFVSTGDGGYRAPSWTVGWDQEDLDRDGHPGVTVQVDNAVCDGQVYTASHSVSRARGQRSVDGAMSGEITVTTRERVHGASRMCLKAGSSEREDVQDGRFAYRRVPDGTRCGDLDVKAWPVKVDTAADTP